MKTIALILLAAFACNAADVLSSAVAAIIGSLPDLFHSSSQKGRK